ncbi:phosphoenolpyruvate synthase [Paenibacillus doosanensis]|uniref:phosphoenolpyruvate synthase n=1 Tax=Paenibacillus doosanensis TaxID=1229154 RepID=UPI0021800354|nr:phosphoenolpyruvate synthase [Paenibacillus doosanensis]MCS7459649.1 phosphoenolpyruvate synthase [Paenibacillus doosanensis]
MSGYVLEFRHIDRTSLPQVGGKGANLGEMTQAGFPVPPGFCVTTEAYRAFIERSGAMEGYFRRLEGVGADQLEAIAELGGDIRGYLQTVAIPEEVSERVVECWSRLGEVQAYAVRSSATAEDLPTASFAGQQDTYLNVCGKEQLLQAIRRCWASLFTDRAISYRAKNGFDHRSVLLSVVVQQMVFPEVSGIMFTADPVSGHRGTVSIDASFGLGEALVSGLVSADLYQVRSGGILTKKIARKKLAIYALPGGGTQTQELPEAMQERQALSDERIEELAGLGERIKRHYGADQDIEWCWADGRLYIVQSRPITSLYPLPDIDIAEGESPHVLLSFGHQQMMTDAMKPLAIDVLRTMLPFGKPALREPSRLAYSAGGRIFLDMTPLFSLRSARRLLPKLLTAIDEQMASGIAEYIRQDDFVRGLPKQKGLPLTVLRFMRPIAFRLARNLIAARPEQAAAELNDWMETFIRESEQRLAGTRGEPRIVGLQERTGAVLRKLFTEVMAYPMAGIVSSRLIARLAERWLGETDMMPILNKSLPGNVTSELGLMIGDLADAARRSPEVTRLLQDGDAGRLGLAKDGGEFVALWDRFMELYGMRCPGEIDITRPRWRDDAGTLLPSIVSHMRTMEPGEHRERFAQGAREAERAAEELTARVRALPFGRLKAKLMSRLLRVYRHTMGLREHPKYTMIRWFGMMRGALLEDAQELVRAGTLDAAEDAFYLTLEELRQAVQGQPDERLAEIIAERKREYERFRGLTPPRAMTSDGEMLTGRRKRQDAPEGALLGTPVSAGVVEGIARVVLQPSEARLNKGEIMIAPFTDPGWTPLFHSAIGLVMEVGGLMTHGAVVAREYGLPAVVGIDGATRRIRDGDYIRVDGTRGYVLILPKPEGEDLP